MRILSKSVFSALAICLAAISVTEARIVERYDAVAPDDSPYSMTQQNCMSLSQAIESVRRRGNVERVISANTRVSGGRETHYIKVLTKDGKVRTHKVAGCKR